MSTRANILIQELGAEVWVFHHFDGYPSWLGVELVKKLKKLAKERCYLDAFEFANSLLKDKDDDGYELTKKQHGDIEFLYVINLESKELEIWSTRFDSFSHKLLFKQSFATEEGCTYLMNFCKTSED